MTISLTIIDLAAANDYLFNHHSTGAVASCAMAASCATPVATSGAAMDMKGLLDELIIRPLEVEADARERGLVARDGEVEITIEAFEPNTVAGVPASAVMLGESRFSAGVSMQ